MSFSTPPPADLSIQIVGNDYHGDSTKAGIRVFQPKSHFHVVITNQSDRNIRLWEEWNSWGYFNLTFEIYDTNGESIGTIKKSSTIWSRNFPSWLELAPKQHHVINVYLNPSDWEIPIEPMGPREGPTDYRMVAKYAITECEDSRKRSVWTGKAETDPVEIILGYWPK